MIVPDNVVRGQPGLLGDLGVPPQRGLDLRLEEPRPHRLRQLREVLAPRQLRLVRRALAPLGDVADRELAQLLAAVVAREEVAQLLRRQDAVAAPLGPVDQPQDLRRLAEVPRARRVDGLPEPRVQALADLVFGKNLDVDLPREVTRRPGLPRVPDEVPARDVDLREGHPIRREIPEERRLVRPAQPRRRLRPAHALAVQVVEEHVELDGLAAEVAAVSRQHEVARAHVGLVAVAGGHDAPREGAEHRQALLHVDVDAAVPEAALAKGPDGEEAALGLLFVGAQELAPAHALSTTVVISQVYGGGGATSGTPTYINDYIELFNRGNSPVTLTGYALQYGSSAGNFGASASQIYAISTVTIQPGKYLLIQVGGAGTVGAALPVTPDQTTGNISMSAASGKIALANTATGLGCGATATPCTLPDVRIVDSVSYGASNNGEGGTPMPSTVRRT